MKCVFTSMDPLMAEQVSTLLESSGIACVIEHRDLRPLAGPVPFVECWPEVWVLDDNQGGEAETLVRQAIAPSSPSTDLWRCERCNQMLERQFTSCWKCEGRIAQEVARADQRRLRAAYPRLLFWIVLGSMAAAAFAVLKSQYGAWP